MILACDVASDASGSHTHVKLRLSGTVVRLQPISSIVSEPEEAAEDGLKVMHACNDAAENTDLTMADILELENQLCEVKEELSQLKSKCNKLQFRIESISNDDNKIRFYTGFSTFPLLLACFNFLGPSVNNLTYWSTGTSEAKSANKAC